LVVKLVSSNGYHSKSIHDDISAFSSSAVLKPSLAGLVNNKQELLE